MTSTADPSPVGRSNASWLKGIGRLLVCAGAWLIPVAEAAAQIVVHIDRRSQTMVVTLDGTPFATWRVSTARRGYRTPAGLFHPRRLERIWRSRKYDLAPMPHSIFFSGGYAIHGTYEVRFLGRPVSHGCVRLSPANAAILYNLVKERGRGATTIRITARQPPTASDGFFRRMGTTLASSVV